MGYDIEKEKREAIEAGRRALNSLQAAKENLNSAKNWGLVDMFGGGFFTTMLKHSKKMCIRDRIGSDITKMSNFFEEYVKQMTTSIQSNAVVDIVKDFPLVDIGVLGEVVQYAKAIVAGEYSLLPDFDHLPTDIREKLKKGIYTVGESRQVDGNLRAVILDEGGTRVKDITLKQVRNDPGALETSRSITMQLQMKQLAAKLDEIQELQSYQIDRDRDRDMVTPFLNARDFIFQAQNKSDLEEQKLLLQKASDQLTNATNAVYTDIKTSADHLAKLTARPLFRNTKQIQNYMSFLALDMQLATKFAGVHMQVLDYLSDNKSAQLISERYQYVLKDFFIRGIGKKNIPAAEILQMNFPYTESNRDSWYYLQKEMIPVLESGKLTEVDRPVYLVSVEE